METITYGELTEFCNTHKRIPSNIILRVSKNFKEQLNNLLDEYEHVCACYMSSNYLVPVLNESTGKLDRIEEKHTGKCSMLGPLKEVNCKGGKCGCEINWDNVKPI